MKFLSGNMLGTLARRQRLFWKGTHVNNLIKKLPGFVLTSALLLFFACDKKQCPPAFARINDRTLRIETVDTPQKRAMGLMFRDSLCENCGMLFIFDEPAVQNFWMKNTKIPLSIAFINSKMQIVKICDMEPFDEASRHSSEVPVLYALEVNKNWFSKNRIKTGDSVELLTADKKKYPVD